MALNNTQYQAIMRDYDQKQARNRQIHDTRINEVYSEIPRIAEIDREISEISVRQAKKLISGDTNALIKLKEELKSLSVEKAELLDDNGFAPDYLQPIYDCPDCHDTGYTKNGDKCHCFVQASIDLLYTQSNIKDILDEENFNTFRLDYFSSEIDPKIGLSPLDNITKAVETAKEFIRKFSFDYQNILLCGNTGTGKTFLANCIAKEIIENSYSVLYFSAARLFEQLGKATFDKNNNSESSVYSDVVQCDLLVIDDLGTELTNSFVSTSLFTCLNERHLCRKSTIISTNLSLTDIKDKYSERISSRISLNYQIIKLFGNDIRIQKRLSNL